MSPCWSNQMIESAASPATAPQVVRQLPASTTGKRPSVAAFADLRRHRLADGEAGRDLAVVEALDLADLLDLDVVAVERQHLDQPAGDQRIRPLAETFVRGARCHRAPG